MTGSEGSTSGEPGTPRAKELLRVGKTEIYFLTAETEREVTAFRKGPRQFLREKGVDIGDSEPIILQEACRDPDPTSQESLNFLCARKTCNFAQEIQISIILIV